MIPEAVRREVPDEDTLEAWLWGDVVRLWRLGRDRRGHGPRPEVVLDHVTGLPASPSELLPDADAVRGAPLVLACLFLPGKWAADHMGLSAHKVPEWSAEARAAVDLTEARLRRVLRRAAGREPPLVDCDPDCGLGELGRASPELGSSPGALVLLEELDGTVHDLGDPARCTAFRITLDGLLHARDVTDRLRPWLGSGPVSMLADMPPEQLAQAAAWIQEERRREAGG